MKQKEKSFHSLAEGAFKTRYNLYKSSLNSEHKEKINDFDVWELEQKHGE